MQHAGALLLCTLSSRASQQQMAPWAQGAGCLYTCLLARAAPRPQVTQNEGLRMLLSKAQAIDELESSIPGWAGQECRGQECRALRGCPAAWKLQAAAQLVASVLQLRAWMPGQVRPVAASSLLACATKLAPAGPPCSWIERLFPGLYPRYLHVLRVDPDRMDAVRQAGAFVGQGGAGNTLGMQQKHELHWGGC